MAKKIEDLTDSAASPVSGQDISWFKKSVAKVTQNRESYGRNLTDYEMFLISVGAITWYPSKRNLTVSAYKEEHLDGYIQKYVLENHPMLADHFKNMSRPMMTDENKKKYRWMRSHFVPRLFWDDIYQMARG